jgi:hypothetical protein
VVFSFLQQLELLGEEVLVAKLVEQLGLELLAELEL